MNRRIKIEGAVTKSNKMKSTRALTRGKSKPARSISTKKKTAVITKRNSKKRNSILESSSEDEFLLPFERKNTKQTTVLKRPQLCRRSESVGITSNNATQNVKRRSVHENIYQISDSSDEELNNLLINEHAVVDLCDTENDTDISVIDIICEKIKAQTHKQDTKQGTDSYPSTSKGLVSVRNVGDDGPSRKVEHDPIAAPDDMTEFIDNLLDTNKDFIKDSGLKSLKELNEETDKLLASSWDLISKDTSCTNVDNSVIYVCTDKYPKQSPAKQDKPSEVVPTASVDLEKQKDQEQNKPSCPICLEEFGQEPTAATICGHIFCATCINNCVKTQRRCPTCRKRLTAKMVHPLFLF